MKLPKIDTDDALLFGSLAAFALGVTIVAASLTEHLGLAVGLGMIVFGAPSAVIAFLAAAEPPK